MKKLVSFLMVLSLVFSMCACKSKAEKELEESYEALKQAEDNVAEIEKELEEVNRQLEALEND